MKDAQSAMTEAIAKAALGKIDKESLAKKLAPKLEQDIMARILIAVKRMDWQDFMYDALHTKELEKAIGDAVARHIQSKLK
jgi:hypothetical protein